MTSDPKNGVAMQSAEVIREGERIMTICNSCRYCEGFCAVFPAVERRLAFAEADMNYLANLCHNCTECLNACQYTAPHPFAVNVPVTLARIRLRSYEKYCWPRALGFAFRRHGVATALGIACGLSACVAAISHVFAVPTPAGSGAPASFYQVVPHGVMAGTFGVVFLLVVAAMIVGVARYVKDTARGHVAERWADRVTGLRHALSLKYLHSSGADCTTRENHRTRWRRWSHHLTFYGFLLCFASTCVAAVYHSVLQWPAPYPLFSLPVLLGTLGGLGLLFGPLGLWVIRVGRDPANLDPAQTGLDVGFIVLLLLTSGTGLALLALRDTAAMGPLLIAHLGIVLTLFVTLPYGKFVHGLYRTAALIQSARESRAE
jgi:citrate/tricarballylate utilization protein